MIAQLIQPSFAAGEISPDVYSRVDIAKYQVGLRTSLNGFIRAQGGWSNRPGLMFVAPVKDQSRRARLIKFQFSTTQTYMLEFGHLYMRVIKDGGMVLEASKTITGATQANPCVITSNAHGFSNGDTVFIASVGGMTRLNNRWYTVANATTNTFELKDAATGVNVNTTGYGAYTSGGTVARVYTIATPYTESDLPTLGFTQSADVMTLVHPGYAPRELTRTGHTAWTLTTITFAPSIAAPGSPSAVATVGTGSTTYRYVVTAVAAETFEESLPSSSASCTNNLNTAGNYNTFSYAAVSGAVRYYIYREVNSSGIYGYIGSATGTSFVDANIQPDQTDTPPAARNPFNATNKYPGAVSYHEQRRVFGYSNTLPQTVWATQAGNYKNMNVSNPAQDDDAWTFNIASQEVNAVRHLVSLGDLIVLTSGGEFIFKPGQDGDTITPSSIAVKNDSRYGSSHLPPIVVGKTILFGESSQSTDAFDTGYAVRDIGYTFNTNEYNGNDLTILAKHLFEFDRLREWAYAKRPFGIVWGLRTDGVGCALTYLREHEVWAWHRHTTDGDFESVGSCTEQGEDAVYWIVNRTINGTARRYIERMKTRKFRNVEDAFFVDCGLTLDNYNTTATTVTLTGGTTWGTGETLTLTASGSTFAAGDVGKTFFLRKLAKNGTIEATARVTVTAYTSGTVVSVTPVSLIPTALRGVATTSWAFAQTQIGPLDHLEGKTLSILADGNVAVQQTVTNGVITLPDPAAKAHCGLPYNSDFQTLAIAGDIAKGSLIGVPINVGKVALVVQETRGIFIGPNESKLKEVKQRQFENWAEPTRLKTGVVEAVCDGTWNDGSFLVRQSDPLPLTILAVIPSVEIGAK